MIKYRTKTSVGLLCMSFMLACSHNHDHNHDHKHADHGDHTKHDMHESNHDEAHKSVILNKAQFLNAEIDTGWFSQKNLTDVIHANGYTKLDPQDQADVSMPIMGTIKDIKVIEGNYVKKGQTLAIMSSIALADMLLEKAKLQEQAALAEEKKIFLEKEYKRQSILAQENINARKVFEKINSELNIERKKISAIQQQLEILKQTISMSGGNMASHISIKAPISGHITHSDLKIGATVKAGTTMFSIVDNSKMHVDLLLYEKDLSHIKVGQKVRFMITNQSNEEITGEIYNIGKAFANDTKSVAVHADIENNNANLIPGMYLSALIDIGQNTVTALPEEAIVTAEGRNFIFLWDAENIKNHGEETEAYNEEINFKRTEVKTGTKQLGFVAVTPLEKIYNGDKIVIKGAYYLQSHLQKTESGGGHHH